MPLSRKDKSASAEKSNSSLSSKLKNVFSKDKGGPAAPSHEHLRSPLPHRPVNFRQADDTFFRRPSPSPSPVPSYGYRPPQDSNLSQGPPRPQTYDRSLPEARGRPQNGLPLQRPPPNFAYTQVPNDRNVGYPRPPPPPLSKPNFSSPFAQQSDVYESSSSYHTHDDQLSLRPPNLFPPQQISRPSSAQANAPVPQFVVVQAPDDDLSEEDDDRQLVLLVPTEDGRYLPVNFAHGRPDFRVPSPSVIVSGRQEQQRVVYLQSGSNSSDESLFAAPPPVNRFLEYNERHTEPIPRFVPVEADDESVDLDPPSFPSTPGPGTPGGTQAPNLNRRYDYLPESMVPTWYLKTPVCAPQGSRQYLCPTCRHIDLLGLFRQEETDVMPMPRDYIALGSLLSIVSRRECGMCSLVAGIVAFDTGIDLPLNMPDEEKKEKQRARLIGLMEEVYYLCPIRFKTTYRTPSLYVCSGTEIAQLSRQPSAVRPRRSMAIRPIHRSERNLGRLLMKPDQIDFAWIRERMDLCDERDEGKLDYKHTVQLRVIDVDRLCIIDLEESVRYVTLSYTWGKAKQVRLLRNNEVFFRTGGLGRIYNELPKTIADSIQLVRKIGERYLWVDALCILQDDDEDKKTQIGAMGTIYKNSILTICACCGEDANYGLPGMEPGTRKTRQVAEVVGDLIVGNAMADSEAVEGAKWDSRAWTLQEKVLSQRKLYISDMYVLWWCWHTITAEDENCRHSGWQPGTRHRGMYFYKSEHDLIVSKMRKSSNMDIYAFIITDYTARDLTSQMDAEHAVTGAMNAIVGLFRGEFVQGLPDTELSAALLWVPLGKHARRVHPQSGEPLFPSWSWLGWVGHVAYPWLIERALPMSEDGSPLLWKNQRADAKEEEKWFTGEMYRMDGLRPNLFERVQGRPRRWSLDDNGGWTWIDQYSESHRFLHPVEDRFEDRFSFFDQSSRRLCFRTLSAHFKLDGRVQLRKENHDYLHTVRIIRVLNPRGFSAGYIYVPDLSDMSNLDKSKFNGDTPRQFIVLSRASTNPDPRIHEEVLYTTPIAELHNVYSMSYMLGAMERLRPADGEAGEGADSVLDELAYFDTRLYDAMMPWGLFNVLMIERLNGVAYRVAVGRIHVAAFMEAEPVEQEIVLE